MSPPRPPLVLILTHTQDHYTIDRVADQITQRGGHSLRLDTDLFPARTHLSVELDSPHTPSSDWSHHWIDAGTATSPIEARDIQAVWARRIWTPTLDTNLAPHLHDGCMRESSAALYAFLDGFAHAHWINPLGPGMQAENKLLQLRAAHAVGLATPRTLVSNDPERVRAFHSRMGGRVVAKMLTPLTISMDRASIFVHTSRVAAEDLEHLDGLRHAPMVFQQEIDKDVELRVICVDGELHVGAIDASRSASGQVDWRRSLPGEVAWQHAELPRATGELLHALLARLGLRYGAVDMIRTPRGEHVFLEINPGGEWGMLERDLGLPIAASIARALLEPRLCAHVQPQEIA